MYILVNIYIYIYMHVHVHIYIYICMCVVYIYIYIYMYTYVSITDLSILCLLPRPSMRPQLWRCLAHSPARTTLLGLGLGS